MHRSGSKPPRCAWSMSLWYPRRAPSLAARQKKRRPEAPFSNLLFGSEHVLDSDADCRHVRTLSETTVRALSAGEARDGDSVRSRAGDVVVARADLGTIGLRGDPVVDLGVGHVHLGALRQHVVVAERVHLRLDRARCSTDYGYGIAGTVAALAFSASVATPHCAGTDVPP